MRDKKIANRREYIHLRSEAIMTGSTGTGVSNMRTNDSQKQKIFKKRLDMVKEALAGFNPVKGVGGAGSRAHSVVYSRQNPNISKTIRQKGSQGKHRQYKGTTSSQSLKQRAANNKRIQKSVNRSYGKGKFTLNKVL